MNSIITTLQKVISALNDSVDNLIIQVDTKEKEIAYLHNELKISRNNTAYLEKKTEDYSNLLEELRLDKEEQTISQIFTNGQFKNEIFNLFKSGLKIQAIKRIREEAGVGLKVGKRTMEQLWEEWIDNDTP